MGLRVVDSIQRLLRLYCDNSAAVFLAKNDKSRSQSKHIDIKYSAIGERVKENKGVIEQLSTELMIADPLTKGMSPKKLRDHVINMGLGSIKMYSHLLYEHIQLLTKIQIQEMFLIWIFTYCLL